MELSAFLDEKIDFNVIVIRVGCVVERIADLVVNGFPGSGSIESVDHFNFRSDRGQVSGLDEQPRAVIFAGSAKVLIRPAVERLRQELVAWLETCIEGYKMPFRGIGNKQEIVMSALQDS